MYMFIQMFKTRATRATFGTRDTLFRGFTLPELIITMTILMTLLLISTISLVNVKQRTSLTTSLDLIIGDIRMQQLKAMVGDTEQTNEKHDYGIHFASSTYVLFRGSTYDATDTANLTIQYGDNISLVGASRDVVFSRVTGEIVTGAISIVFLEGTTGSQRTLTLNKYGVVTSLQ
jgi:prepilin-type N-terminal cleavage/methylation domain-containing protein